MKNINRTKLYQKPVVVLMSLKNNKEVNNINNHKQIKTTSKFTTSTSIRNRYKNQNNKENEPKKIESIFKNKYEVIENNFLFNPKKMRMKSELNI